MCNVRSSLPLCSTALGAHRIRCRQFVVAGSWCAAGRVAPCTSFSPHISLLTFHIAALPALLVYRSGQLVRGWEGGILRFLAARFAEKHGFLGSIQEALQVRCWGCV